jgi:H/ACA ribonucleoprotein complex subunit 4
MKDSQDILEPNADSIELDNSSIDSSAKPITLLPYEKAVMHKKVLIKCEAETDPAYGIDPNKRSVPDLLNYGIVNVNKFKGPTSHEIADFVKRILSIEKAGQSGTLDPGVTGVLPVGLGKATRVLSVLLTCGKEYVCLMHVHQKIEDEKLKEGIMSFVGKIMQMPPIKSAVKRQLRERRIYYIEILEIKGQDVLFRVGCEAGTYIRKLCDDIGKKLGTGAHMAQLIRTKVGMFDSDNMYSLQEISDGYYDYVKNGSEKIRDIIFPIEKTVEHIPKIWVMDSAVEPLCQGFFLAIPGIVKLDSDVSVNNGHVALMTLKNELIGLGNPQLNSQEIMKKTRGVAVKIDSVIMAQGTYPRWKQEDKKAPVPKHSSHTESSKKEN